MSATITYLVDNAESKKFKPARKKFLRRLNLSYPNLATARIPESILFLLYDFLFGADSLCLSLHLFLCFSYGLLFSLGNLLRSDRCISAVMFRSMFAILFLYTVGAGAIGVGARFIYTSLSVAGRIAADSSCADAIDALFLSAYGFSFDTSVDRAYSLACGNFFSAYGCCGFLLAVVRLLGLSGIEKRLSHGRRYSHHGNCCEDDEFFHSKIFRL